MLAREEFEIIYRAEFPRLVLFLVKDGAPRAVAEDVAQDAMTQLYVRAVTGTGDPVRSPRAWARKAALQILKGRMQKERQGVPLEEPAQVPLASPDDTATVVEEAEVVRLFRLLPKAQRRVLALDYDGFTDAEIAEVVGVSVDTVRSNRRHGRKRIKEEIAEHIRGPGTLHKVDDKGAADGHFRR